MSELEPRVYGGTWEVVRRLSRGGMGVVYVARHKARGDEVALKVLYDKEQDFSGAAHERFVREANASMEIGHPGLVRTFEAGVEPDGTRYIVMELLEGQSLRDRMREGLPRRRGLELVLDLLDPLAAAHAKGFIHRDLKPQNAFVVRDETGRERVKLLDFGISRHPGVRTVTDFATAMGTPHYAAPEQMQDARGVTAAADVWSIGVLLYRLLAGRLPFEGDALHMVIAASEHPHEPLGTLVPNLDPRLGALVDRCLAKSAADRCPHAGAVRDELAALLADPTLALPEDELPEEPAPPSVAQTLPVEGTRDDRQRGDTDESTTPDAPAVVVIPSAERPPERRAPSAEPRAPSTSASAEPRAPGTSAEPRAPSPSPEPRAPSTSAEPPRSRPSAAPPLGLPPPPAAPPPAAPLVPELTPRPPPRIALSAAVIAALAIAVGIEIARDRPQAPSLRAIPLARTVVPAAPEQPASGKPAVSATPQGPRAEDKDEPGSDEIARMVLSEIVVGPRAPLSASADLRARRRARELDACLPITDAAHGRCFLRALGDEARGEFELRNLVAAALITGDGERALAAAQRYLAEHPQGRYAAQVRQIETGMTAESAQR